MPPNTPLPFPPQSVPIRKLRERLAEIFDIAALRALRDADPRTTSTREYDRRIEELEEAQTEPAEPNPVVVSDTPPSPPAATAVRAYMNPRLAATTVRIARTTVPLEVTAENREQIESARVSLDGRSVPLFEIRG